MANALCEAPSGLCVQEWMGSDLEKEGGLIHQVSQSRGTRLGARINPAAGQQRGFLARLIEALPDESAVGRILWNVTGGVARQVLSVDSQSPENCRVIGTCLGQVVSLV